MANLYDNRTLANVYVILGRRDWSWNITLRFLDNPLRITEYQIDLAPSGAIDAISTAPFGVRS